jgi:DNA-binding transcriptional LysR family regulator
MNLDTLLERKGLSLDRMRAFLAVAEAGGISRAAPGEPVRQSQLSRQIGELEAALEVALFSRVRRRLALTLAGERLLRVVRELSRGLSDLRVPNEPVQVGLGAGDSVLQWLVLPKLGALGVQARVRLVALSAAEVVGALEEHAIDLGILRSNEPTRDLRRTVVGKVEYAVFSPRRAPQAPLAIATAEPRLRGALASLGAPGLECETFPQVAAALESGRFRGVLPLIARQGLRGSFEIERVPALDSVATNLVMAWRPRLDHVRPDVGAFRKSLLAALRAG